MLRGSSLQSVPIRSLAIENLAASFLGRILDSVGGIDEPTPPWVQLRAGDRDAASMTDAKGTLLRWGDLVPAHLFGPGHGSLTYGLEIDGAVGRSHGFPEQVITNEINRQD